MIARPAGRCRHNGKAERAEIEPLDKGLDHPRRIVGVDMVFQRSRQKRCLRAILALAIALHSDLPMEVEPCHVRSFDTDLGNMRTCAHRPCVRRWKPCSPCKARLQAVIRTIGIACATIKIGPANMAYNIRPFIWIEARARRVPRMRSRAIRRHRRSCQPQEGLVRPWRWKMDEPPLVRPFFEVRDS
jgi:hypothetical protein